MLSEIIWETTIFLLKASFYSQCGLLTSGLTKEEIDMAVKRSGVTEESGTIQSYPPATATTPPVSYHPVSSQPPMQGTAYIVYNYIKTPSCPWCYPPATVRLRWTGIFPPATVEKNQVEMIKSHKTRWFYAQVNPQSTVVYPHLVNSGRCESWQR